MRERVRDSLEFAAPVLRPQARPVDTFVRPTDTGAGPGEALAGALSKLDRVAIPILDQISKEEAEKDLAEGERAFVENRLTFAEAVRTGVIPAGASPHVRRGYRAALLQTVGSNYATQLSRSLEQSEIYKVSDPAQIDGYIGEFYKKFTKSNELQGYDPREIKQFFAPMASQSHRAFRQAHVRKNVAWVKQERFTAFQGQVLATIENQPFNGSRSQVQGAIRTTSQWLHAKVSELDAEGLDRTEITQTVVDMMTDAAVAQEDPDILSVLRVTRFGTNPISETRYARAKIDAARKRITAAQEARAARARAAASAARTARLRQAEMAATKAAAAGDRQAFAEALRVVGGPSGSASSYRSLLTFQQRQNDRFDDAMQAGSFADVQRDLLAAGSVEEAIEIVGEQVSSRRLPYTDGQDQLRLAERRLEDLRRAESSILRDPTINQRIEAVAKTVLGDEGIYAPGARQDRAAIYRDIATNRVLDWYDNNAGEDGTFSSVQAVRDLAPMFQELRREALEEQDAAENERFRERRAQEAGELPAPVASPAQTPRVGAQTLQPVLSIDEIPQ